jgi:hypothetical protein
LVVVVAAVSSTTAGRSVSGPSTYRGLTQFLVRSMDKVKTTADRWKVKGKQRIVGHGGCGGWQMHIAIRRTHRFAT